MDTGSRGAEGAAAPPPKTGLSKKHPIENVKYFRMCERSTF